MEPEYSFAFQEPAVFTPNSNPVIDHDSDDEDLEEILNRNVNSHEFGVLANPLLNLSRRRLRALGRGFVGKRGLPEDKKELFADAAVLAQNNNAYTQPDDYLQLNDEARNILKREVTHKWDQPKKLYSLIAVCASAAAVQGWNQTAANGANIFYKYAFNLQNNSGIFGLVNGAPYLCCTFSCLLLTGPMNRYLGRRWTIFATCLLSSVACLSQAFTSNWQQMFALRIILGLGIGPKSATVPIFAAESSPAPIRGAMVMMWQTFTAFGIFLGLMTGVVFFNVGNSGDPNICATTSGSDNLLSLNCLMVGAPMLLPLLVCVHVFFIPESPRWYIGRGEYLKAFDALCQLRNSELQAARDLFYIHCLLHAEREIQKKRNRLVEMVRRPRNRRALQASIIVMFMQQFCGVNTLIHYSTIILYEAVSNNKTKDIQSYRKALLGSMGLGLINFLFALPAVRLIDTRGRRILLLTTFPLMALFMLLMALGFLIPIDTHANARTGVIMLGIYLFAIAYSPGEGPVPFTYSAECYPLYVRDVGMSIATAVTWGFNFLVTMTLPAMQSKLKQTGALGFYAAWNVVGFFLILLFVPETKNRSLEELDRIFSISTRKFASNSIDVAMYHVKRKIFRLDIQRPAELHIPGDDDEKPIVQFTGHGSNTSGSPVPTPRPASVDSEHSWPGVQPVKSTGTQQ
ncbi:MFS sugar transporter [Geopyxis carbonaria]|nr:MFS sugar transporter [Geopyxis carbonaria]